MMNDANLESDSAFSRRILATAEPPMEGPRAFYNEDGDCVEFLVSNEGFYGERIDNLVTVYYGRESGAIVGGLIKDIKRFVQRILKECPGFVIEVEDGPVKLAYLFTAGMWKQGDSVRLHKYKKLRDAAEFYDVSVEMPEFV